MTRKLYYEDSHMRSFMAKVLSCRESDRGWEIVLDATAFYPEGGGQAADSGTLGNVQVMDTRERGEEIVHLCSGALEVGSSVRGEIDYEKRFSRMQQHSGEHMVSGIIFRKYGYHNTGFHMGSQVVTIDFDGAIPPEALEEIELEANRGVYANLDVLVSIPPEETLKTIPYRSKKALAPPVRIVEIPGFDICACCGTHVQKTGEIGIIKLFSVIPCRGGSRIEMACGDLAFSMLGQVYQQNRLVSQAFSAKLLETGEAAQRMNAQLAAEKARAGALEKRIVDSLVKGLEGSSKAVLFENQLSSAALRDLADRLAEQGCLACVFGGSDEEGYQYLLGSRTEDLRPMGKALTTVFPGRGGGKPGFQQGRIQGTEQAIRAYLEG